MGLPPNTPPQQQEEAVNLDPLAGWLWPKWEAAKRAKIQPQREIIDRLRARNCEYSPERLAAIKAVHGPDHVPLYAPITRTKARAAKSWIKDYIFPPGKDPWDIEETPVPELPDAIRQKILEKVRSYVEQQAMAYYETTGALPDASTMTFIAEQLVPEYERRVEEMTRATAQKAARKMKARIRDQFAEGGWSKAIKRGIDRLVDEGTMIIKGPVFTKSPVISSQIDPATGRYVSAVQDRVIETYRDIDSLLFYPSPDATIDVIPWSWEKIKMTRKDMASLLDMGEYGYQTEKIREVLRAHEARGLIEWTDVDQTRHDLAGKNSSSLYETEMIDVLEFWGTAPGRILLAWGMAPTAITDPDKEYDIQAWMVGRWVIKAMLNPDPLGNQNIFVCGFAERRDSFWQWGVYDLVIHAQVLANAAIRAVRSNIAIAGGPQIELNVDRLAQGESGVFMPNKIWLTTTQGLMEGPAVKFYQPEFLAPRIAEIYRFCMELADNDSGIPRYFYTGETSGGGKAGDTASGLQMLMQNAAKGLKHVISSIDSGIIEPSVKTQFSYNMKFEDDPGIIGDIRIVAKGSETLFALEQSAVRKIEMLERTNNPVDISILGTRGRAMQLVQAFESVGLDAKKILDDEERIMAIEDGIRAASMQAIANGGGYAMAPPQVGQPQMAGAGMAPSPGMRQLNAAGAPVAGRDYGEFGSKPGVRP